MADDSKRDDGPLGGLLKKAVSLGAGAYVKAEGTVQDTVQKTLGTVQIPKEMLKEVLENFFEAYTVQIQAEIKIVPKTALKAPKTTESV